MRDDAIPEDVATSARQLPTNLEAERSVLGSVFVRSEAFDEILPLIRGPDDFFVPAHREIWESFLTLSRRGKPIDIISVMDELRVRGAMPRLEGGETYLIQIANEVPSAEGVEHWARLVAEKASVRRLIRVSAEIQARGYGDYGDYDDFINEVEADVFAATQAARGESTTITSAAAMSALISELERREAEKKEITGVPTGIPKFDRMTSGLQPEHFIVIAARPGVGKTSWALNIAARAAIDHKIPVFVLSLEMGKLELLERMLSSESDVPAEALHKGLLRDAWHKIYPAGQKLLAAPIVIDDAGGQTIHEIAAKCRRFRANRTYFPEPEPGARPPLGLIVVDYLQLARSGGKASKRGREEEVGEITRGLKALAKALRLPIIGISQLNRELEKRDDKRPKLSDLRESGSIEQDADVVVFLHRDDYFADEDDTDVVRGKAELLIRKNRHGDLGRVFLSWQKDITRFSPYASELEDSLAPISPRTPRAAPAGYAARDNRLPPEDDD